MIYIYWWPTGLYIIYKVVSWRILGVFYIGRDIGRGIGRGILTGLVISKRNCNKRYLSPNARIILTRP